MHHLQNLAHKTISTAAPAPATPVTLQKRGDNAVGCTQAPGKEDASDSDAMGAGLEGMTEDAGGADGGAPSGGNAPSFKLRGEI